MLHLQLPGSDYAELRQHLLSAEIRADRPRWVFHLDISAADVDHLIKSIEQY